MGLRELELIAESGFKLFPPRLAHQPIFYPVLNFEYAEQIARDWNAREAPFAGFVTKFEVDDPYLQKFEKKRVGGKVHEEFWVPAEQLGEFNAHIVGLIEVAASYYGEQFNLPIDPPTNLPVTLVRPGS